MKSLKIISCGMLGLLAIACSKSDTASAPRVPAVPASLSFQKPAVGAELTKSQVAELKTIFSKKSVMVLPPGELVFPAKNTDPSELAWKESLLARQDPNSAQMLKDIRSGCSKIRPTGNVDATFPLDGANLENLKAGDKLDYSASAGLSGNACPSPFKASSGTGMRVEQIDNASQSGTATGEFNTNLQASIANPRYAQLLNSRGVIMESRVSTIASLADAKSSGVFTVSMSGTYLTLDASIPFSMEVQYLGRQTSTKDAFAEVVMKTSVRFPQQPIEIVVHSVGTGSQSQSSSEIYINGHLTSQAQYEELFGKNNPAGNESSNSALQVLK